MRTATKNIVGILSLGVLASSWSIGQSAETGLTVPAAPATNSTPEATSPETSPAPAASSSPASSSPASSTPTASATPPVAPTKKPAAAKSNTGDLISYKYGAIQLEVVKSGSAITKVNVVQAGTKGPEYAAVPAMLADAAVAANGSNFGNVSGATFTTQAFKSALESALAKF